MDTEAESVETTRDVHLSRVSVTNSSLGINIKWAEQIKCGKYSVLEQNERANCLYFSFSIFLTLSAKPGKMS